MASWLLDRGADLNSFDFQGRTAMQVAAERGYENIVALLQARGEKRA
jgi:ankyrin repeat protein